MNKKEDGMEMALSSETAERLGRLVELLHCPAGVIVGDALSLYEKAIRISGVLLVSEPPKALEVAAQLAHAE